MFILDRFMRRLTKFLSIAILWIAACLALILAPLLVVLIGPAQPGFGFWWDFSMALGFSGMAMMGVQFALTARFRRATAPFGIDIICYFHRYVAVLGGCIPARHIVRLERRTADGHSSLFALLIRRSSNTRYNLEW